MASSTSPMAKKKFAAHMRELKKEAKAVDDPAVVRERSIDRYEKAPRYLRHRMRVKYLVIKHGAAEAARLLAWNKDLFGR